MLAPFLSEHLQEVNDAAANEALGSIEEDTVAGLKSMGCYGLQVPEELGGIGLTNTQVRPLEDSWREAGGPPGLSSPTAGGWEHPHPSAMQKRQAPSSPVAPWASSIRGRRAGRLARALRLTAAGRRGGKQRD